MSIQLLGGSDLITALVPTYNCEETIRETLESVKWVDRVLVVDSYSTDKTLDICREYTEWIVQHEYLNSADQKNWGMEQIQSEWTLQIDSDEQVESPLQDEILASLLEPSQPDGYRIRIKNHVWGKWIRSCGMYPCKQIRLFKTSKGRWIRRKYMQNCRVYQ